MAVVHFIILAHQWLSFHFLLLINQSASTLLNTHIWAFTKTSRLLHQLIPAHTLIKHWSQHWLKRLIRRWTKSDHNIYRSIDRSLTFDQNIDRSPINDQNIDQRVIGLPPPACGLLCPYLPSVLEHLLSDLQAIQNRSSHSTRSFTSCEVTVKLREITPLLLQNHFGSSASKVCSSQVTAPTDWRQTEL